MSSALETKRAFIRAAIARAREGGYPVIEPSAEDNANELSWWIPVFDAKAFLFSENGSATWLFPHYELKLRPLDRRVTVSFAGRTIVDSRKCFEFHETAHPVQIYIPRSEVDFSCLVDSETVSYCPFKNIARYYSVVVGEEQAVDGFWCYEDIYDRLPPSGKADGIIAMKGMLSPDRSRLEVQLG